MVRPLLRSTKVISDASPVVCGYTLDSLGKFGFRAKSGFKNKRRVRACDFGVGQGSCDFSGRARAGLGLQNEARLQLCTKGKATNSPTKDQVA